MLVMIMLTNTVLAGPEAAHATVETAFAMLHENWQELGFWWHVSGWATRWRRLPFAQGGKPNPQGWDGRGAPKMPPLKEQPPETQEERNRRVVSVKLFPESVTLQAGAPVVLQAVGLDASGNPVSGIAFDWSGEDTDKKQSLPVQDSIVTHEAASFSSRGAKVSLPSDASAVVSHKGEFAARKAGHYKVTAEIGGHRAETLIQILDDLKEDATNVLTGAPVSSSDQPVVKAPAGNKTSQAAPRGRRQEGVSGKRRADAPADRVSSPVNDHPGGSAGRMGLQAVSGWLTAGGNLFSDFKSSVAVGAPVIFQSGDPANPDGWNTGNYTTADDPGRETGQIPGHG
ncbi:MAG TPA: hypothetical protein VNQ79_25565 [Blastocatellia bacterium]|nr:hypothetical protein [Blastocatellia bacterium]